MYRRNFLLFAGISVIASVPQAALSGYTSFSTLDTFTQLAAGAQPVDLGQLSTTLWLLLVGVIVNLALVPFFYGAVTYAACEAALGRSVTPSSVVSGVLRRYFPLLGYVLLIALMAIVFCLIPLWIWIWVGWAVVIPVMFIENIGLGTAMGRSWRLVEGRWWRTFLILFLMFIVIYFVNAALGAFLSLAQVVLGVVAAPQIVVALSSAGRVLVGSLVDPVLQILIVLIYFDLRVRREGLDLFQLAQRVPLPPTAV